MDNKGEKMDDSSRIDEIVNLNTIDTAGHLTPVENVYCTGFSDENWRTPTPTALGQLLGHIDFPDRFYHHLCGEGLNGHASTTINLLLEQKDKPVMFRSIGSEIVAVLSPSYFRINNDFVIDATGVLEDGTEEFQVRRYANTPDRLHIRLLTRGLDTGEIGIGVDITNSETGLSALSVNTFVYVLACSNGMIIRQKEVDGVMGGMRKVHRTARADLGVMAEPDVADHRYREIAEDLVCRMNVANDEALLHRIQSRIDEAKTFTDPDHVTAVDDTIKKILTKPEKLTYSGFYRPLEGKSVWGSVQALTAMAHTEELIHLTPRQSVLETRAWDIMENAIG